MYLYSGGQIVAAWFFFLNFSCACGKMRSTGICVTCCVTSSCVPVAICSAHAVSGRSRSEHSCLFFRFHDCCVCVFLCVCVCVFVCILVKTSVRGNCVCLCVFMVYGLCSLMMVEGYIWVRFLVGEMAKVSSVSSEQRLLTRRWRSSTKKKLKLTCVCVCVCVCSRVGVWVCRRVKLTTFNEYHRTTLKRRRFFWRKVLSANLFVWWQDWLLLSLPPRRSENRPSLITDDPSLTTDCRDFSHN